jgi:hypothetical protein
MSTMNDKSWFVKVPVVITQQLVITKQLKLYFNNSSRIPTQYTVQCTVYMQNTDIYHEEAFQKINALY